MQVIIIPCSVQCRATFTLCDIWVGAAFQEGLQGIRFAPNCCVQKRRSSHNILRVNVGPMPHQRLDRPGVVLSGRHSQAELCPPDFR